MSECLLLLLVGGIYALLHDTTAMLVTCNFHALLDHGIVEKLVLGAIPAL